MDLLLIDYLIKENIIYLLMHFLNDAEAVCDRTLHAYIYIY